MRKLFLLAGAGMMLALGAPAAADAKPGKGKAAKAQVHQHGHWDANRNGIADWREGFIDRDRNGIDDRRQRHSWGNKWGGADCPPGLAKKTPRCVPPGQAKRDGFVVGDRFPTRWGSIPFRRIPLSVRNLYDLDDDDRYVYRNGRLYVIDRDTWLIKRIILIGF